MIQTHRRGPGPLLEAVRHADFELAFRFIIPPSAVHRTRCCGMIESIFRLPYILRSSMDNTELTYKPSVILAPNPLAPSPTQSLENPILARARPKSSTGTARTAAGTDLR